MNIGLLMINGENDVLARTLAANARFVDCFYVLDGTVPNTVSRNICESHAKCAGYLADSALDHERFGFSPKDGWRQAIYEQATDDYGYDHWFLLLHGDEVWTGLPNLGAHDGFIFPLPFFFPRAGETWDHNVHPLDQLRWNLGPGYPEFRMFHGREDVTWDPVQHFNVAPSGIRTFGGCSAPIKHYLYRSPEVQRDRAVRHEQTGFDPDNYRHILDGTVYWPDDRIADYQRQEWFRELSCA